MATTSELMKVSLFPPKACDDIKKNLLYSLPENVQHMIFKLSYDNVMKELKNITTFEYTKLRIKRHHIESRNTNHTFFKKGMKTGMLEMINDKALRVFMCMKWNRVKWLQSKYMYTNVRHDDYCHSRNFTIEQMLIKAYSCSVLKNHNHITVPRLKWLCKINGLKVSGSKKELIKRLMSV